MSKYKLPKVEELLDAGVHFGHQVRRWHPKMEPYIYTVRKNIHIIDLEQTDTKLKEACEFLYETAKRGEQIIFVGTKKQAREVIELEAQRCGALYVTERWIGGTITNFKIIKKNIDKLLSYLKRKEEGDLDKYTKKERLLIDREIDKLQRNIGGIVGLKGDPGAMFLVDAKREKTALREANRAGVPVAALVDTNSDPAGIKHVIPGNDDAIKSIALILKAISQAVEQGYNDYASSKEEKEAEVKEKDSAKDNVTKEPEKKAKKAVTKAEGTENSQISTAEAPRKTKIAKEENAATEEVVTAEEQV